MNDPGLAADYGLLRPQDGGAELRYRDLFEGGLLGVYTSRPDGRLVACNGAFASMLGFRSVADAIGAAMSEVYVDPADRDRFIGRLREQGRLEHYRGRLRRRDGGIIEVIETAVGDRDATGALVELHGFLIDVTANVQAESELRERERQFRAVFYDASDAMLILDDSRAIVEANPAACALFGVAVDQIAGRSLDSLFVEDGQLAAAWTELLALGEAKREHRVRSAGAPRYVEGSYRARVHAQRHLCIARDMTDRRLLEARVVQSEKIESVGRLAGGIAHDFNNLLTAILGYTELLLSQCRPEDPSRSDLEEIQKAGRRAAALTQQLLAFSRKQMLRPKDVDLNQTVVGLQSMLTRLIREDITLQCELAPAPAVVRIDPTQIEQVILNLVLNARDALPAGGAIRLEIAKVRRSQASPPTDVQSTAAEYVRLRVVDNGVGLSPDAREHLFEPFFTTKEVGKGTGLGLASVYGIVRQSNGFIAVDSEPGRGTAFTMHFPAAVAAEPESVQLEPIVLAGRRETILLVEDEDAVRAVIGAVLRRQGYQVLEAASPHLACEIFQRYGPAVDLLLTDVVMPEMNGPALAQRLVGEKPELRVLFISGHADLTTPLGDDNPNVGFLGKPFQASVLNERVRQMLARPDAGPSGA